MMDLTRKEKKILLVDDDTDITIVFKLALEDAGFIVDTYQDPSVALSKFKPNSYGLVILDIRMPGMSRFELHKEMQKIDPQLIFCFSSADAIYYDEVIGRARDKRGKEEQYCKLNRERFLQKPISNVDLVKGVEEMMIMRDSS
jgi:DNA-binding NtrC family response regulator